MGRMGVGGGEGVQLSEGLDVKASVLGRAYAAIGPKAYATILDVTAAGYITGIAVALQVEDSWMDFIIEIDGVELPPFEAHASGDSNTDITDHTTYVPTLTDWRADYVNYFQISPLYRFDTSFKIRLHNNRATLNKSAGITGCMTYLTE